MASNSSGDQIKHVTVVGGGMMGAGIAQVTAQAGIKVTLVDLSEEILRASYHNMKVSLQRVMRRTYPNNAQQQDRALKEALGYITLSTSAEEAVRSTDLVIEAIVEKLPVKQKLFRALDTVAPPHTIFASNTSSLLIKDIAEGTKRLDRFGGLHFFNPVAVMKLLEVIRIPETSKETVRKMTEFGEAIGKTTVQAIDTPGFIVNKLLNPYMARAVEIVENGEATVQDVDTAMKLGAGYPMGPFELMDLTGLDVQKHVREINNERLRAEGKPTLTSEIIDRLVSEGKLGRKTGEGFYVYKKKSSKL